MTITTLQGHVSRAIDFYDKQSKYFALGGLEEWDDPTSPPEPKPTDEITSFLGFKKVETCFLVVELPENSTEVGEITYKNRSWKIVTRDKAVERGAHWVYCNSFINYDELPVGCTYRQVGLMTGVTVKESANSEGFCFTPSEIEDKGILETIDNRCALPRSMDMKEQLSVIIEF